MVETYTCSGVVGTMPYISQLQGVLATYDCGWRGDLLWVACDGADSPIKAYNTSGQLQDMIPGSLVGGAAHGIDFDENGTMWVANRDTGKIYEIDTTQGVHGGGTARADLTASCNPFASSVVIAGDFGPGAHLEIYDLGGRTVFSAPFAGSLCWNGSGVPAGTYVVRVSGVSGAGTLRLVKL
jgi:hypothetical protein